jgi:hypothetical protein
MLNRNGAIMKKRVALFTIILIFMIVQAQKADDQLFPLKKYGLKWGMQKKQVENILGIKPYEELILLRKFLGYDCKITFEFEDAGLTSIEYYMQNIGTKPADYIKAYNALYNNLNKVYGMNSADRISSNDKSIVNNKDRWGSSLKEDKIAFQSIRKLNDYVIVQTLSGLKGLELSIIFYDPKFYEYIFERSYVKAIKEGKESEDYKGIVKNWSPKINAVYELMKKGKIPSSGNDLLNGYQRGMSRDEIKKNPHFQYLSENEKRLEGITLVFDLPMKVEFTFNESKGSQADLDMISYYQYDILKHPKNCITDFKRINKILIEKYGQPERKHNSLLGLYLRIEPENYLEAFEGSGLRYTWYWSLTDFSIKHEMGMSGGILYHHIRVIVEQ